MEQLLKRSPRIEVVDALRGFAVMAIILVHNLEHFIFPVYPTDSPCLPERHTPFLPYCSALPFISKAITKRPKARILDTVSYGVWYCWQVLPR